MGFLIGTGGNSVHVNISSPMCSPGAVVTGEVYVNVQTPTDCSGVFLKVCGKERVRWTETHTRHVPSTRSVYRHGRYHTEHTMRAVQASVPVFGNRNVFKVEIGLMQGGELLQGQYTIPFSFTLPTDIPGSLSLTGYHGQTPYSCSVSYGVKAIVRVPSLLKSNLRHVAALTVIQPAPTFCSNIEASASGDIIKMCCFNKGRADLSFHCAKDSFSPGEPVCIVANAVNESSSRLARLTIKLRRNLQLVSDSGRILYVEETIAERIYAGLEAHTQIKDSLMSVVVPHDAPQQCIGSSIRCLYSVRLSGKVRWGVDVKCSAPAFIYERMLAAVALEYSPSWQPQLLHGVVVDIGSSGVLIPTPLSMEEYPDCESMRPSAPLLRTGTSEQDPANNNKQAVDGAQTILSETRE